MNVKAIIITIITLSIWVIPACVGIAILLRGRESFEDSYPNSKLKNMGFSFKFYKIFFRVLALILLIFSGIVIFYQFVYENLPQPDVDKEFWDSMDKNKDTKFILNTALLLAAIAIPARMSSTRFPGKPLKKLGGKCVLEHVYAKCVSSKNAQEVFILTDSQEIEDFAKSIGAKCIMTSPDCQNGTERIVEAMPQINAEFIVNVQGDEPFIPPALIDSLFEIRKKTNCELATAASEITDPSELSNPNNVKVLTNASGKIIYFSRSPLPFVRGESDYSKWLQRHKYLKHIGIYGYSKTALSAYKTLPKSELELCESLEQLRFIDAGYTMELVETNYIVVGIDTPEDLVHAENLLSEKQ